MNWLLKEANIWHFSIYKSAMLNWMVSFANVWSSFQSHFFLNFVTGIITCFKIHFSFLRAKETYLFRIICKKWLLFMSPVSPVFHTEVTMSIGLQKVWQQNQPSVLLKCWPHLELFSLLFFFQQYIHLYNPHICSCIFNWSFLLIFRGYFRSSIAS